MARKSDHATMRSEYFESLRKDGFVTFDGVGLSAQLVNEAGEKHTLPLALISGFSHEALLSKVRADLAKADPLEAARLRKERAEREFEEAKRKAEAKAASDKAVAAAAK